MITKSDINYYKNNGEIKLKNFISKLEVKNLKKEYKNYVKNLKRLRIGQDFNFLENSNLPSSLHRLEKEKKTLFYKIAKKSKILKAVENLMRKKSRLHSIQLFLKNKTENLPTPMHQDNAYWCFRRGKGISVWIPLNSTGKKNGTLYYLQGSQMKSYPHASSWKTPGSSLVIKKLRSKFNKKFYNLKAGDAVAHDSKTIHGSFPNKSKITRMAYILNYVTKDSIKNTNKSAKYEKKLVKISNTKKYN